MSPLRVLKCPKCGVRHYIGHPCPTPHDSQSKPGRTLGRAIATGLVFMISIIAFVAVSMIVADAKGRGYGVAVAVGIFLLLHLWRLGHEWDDGIDFWTLMLPGPLDWGDKINRLINFWAMPRPFFRAMYLASAIALVIVLASLYGFHSRR